MNIILIKVKVIKVKVNVWEHILIKVKVIKVQVVKVNAWEHYINEAKGKGKLV